MTSISALFRNGSCDNENAPIFGETTRRSKKKISESCYGRVGVVRVYVLPSIVFGTKLFPLVIGYVLNYSRIVFKQNFHS